MNCRFCSTELKHEFIDLNFAPASNSFLKKEQLNEPEVFYPLKLYVCENCLLVQIDEYKKSDEIFNKEYAYFSSFSTSWLEHSKKYVEMISEKLNLGKDSHVVEIASNDGYLLQYFKEKEISCLGVEPTFNTAAAARKKGIEVIQDFFGERLANSLKKADLIIGNNVLAHVPNINDFVKGLKIALKNGGTITMEFPHLMRLVEENQFDTIYHEHFSYLSLHTVQKIFKAHGLLIYDVEELPTHGGSLRIYAKNAEELNPSINKNIEILFLKEAQSGLHTLTGYENFQEKAKHTKKNFLSYLLDLKKEGKRIIGYGAAAKGNTLLNYCGINKDLIDFVVDKSPYKQGMYLPGSHIPVVDESYILKTKPDYIIIFPWNIKEEVKEQLSYVKEWGCQFATAIPELRIFQ